MKRVKFNILMGLITAAYIAILIIGNVVHYSVPAATVEGSYASDFAKHKHLKSIELADTQEKYFDQRYEVFDYDVNTDGTITLQSYKGVSTTLVIPCRINGRVVSTIAENFFSKATFVKEVYLPVTIKEIKGEPTKNVHLYCDKDSEFIKNADAEMWDAESLYDSEYVDFFRGDIPFEYNENGDSIDIKQYTGEDTFIVIPSYINGKPVTKVSMDILGRYDFVVFPETVKSITGQVSANLYTTAFAIELVMSVIAFILVMIMVNIIIPRYKNDSVEEYLLSAPQIISAFAYLIIQVFFSVLVIYKSIVNAYIALIISIILLVVYIALNFTAGGGRTHAVNVEEKIEKKTSWMKKFKVMTADLANNIEDKEARKVVERLVEDIRFSDPVTSDSLTDIENRLSIEIEELRTVIVAKDAEEIIKAANKAEETLNKRNMLCKQMK